MTPHELNHAEATNSARPEDSPPSPLPPEVATLLIVIGVVGMPLPGPGIPFILAGGLSLWPRTFRPLERRFRTRYPESHNKVSKVLKRFEDDLSRRYPMN